MQTFFRFFLASITCFLITSSPSYAVEKPGIVVLQTDFGNKDGAVSAVKGVMRSVNKSLIIEDLTQDIPPYNIWEASYRLYQVASYWPKGTVFVSVVDPGVGTARHSVVAETNNGYYFVTPDNGTLTLVKDHFGIKEVREIDEVKNRLKNSTGSYTFHGRDVYGYTAAKLASGKINFSDVGPILKDPITELPYKKAFLKENVLHGTIAILDPQYGNVWTNISDELVKQLQMEKGQLYKVTIFHHDKKKYQSTMPFDRTFGEVPKGKNLLYLNSLMNLAIGTNQESFAKDNRIESGPNWSVEIEKVK